MPQHSDEQLVIMVLNGNQDAFSILVERYQKQVFSLAYRLGGDYDEARDMAQECFLKIYQELPRYDSSRRFFSWMYRVAQNTCLNLLKKRPKEILAEDEMLQSNRDMLGLDPTESYEQSERSAFIMQAIMDLPDKYRDPVLLKYIWHLSYQEIATRLNLPLTTIETRLFRGRNMLKEKLSTYIK